MDSPKHIKDYETFKKVFGQINEQEEVDQFAEPQDSPAPVSTAPKKYRFIFIDEGKSRRDYPGGGYIKKFTSYEISETELDEWIDKNISGDNNSEDMKEIVIGQKMHMTKKDRALAKDFKRNIMIDHIGSKSNEVEVEFDEKDVPMTDDIEITFIDTEK